MSCIYTSRKQQDEGTRSRVGGELLPQRRGQAQLLPRGRLQGRLRVPAPVVPAQHLAPSGIQSFGPRAGTTQTFFNNVALVSTSASPVRPARV